MEPALPKKYPPVGRCIYCGAETYRPHDKRPLGAEHIVSEALGDRLILPEASCARCEDLTKKQEDSFLRNTLGPARTFLKLPTKRPKNRPKQAPVFVPAVFRAFLTER